MILAITNTITAGTATDDINASFDILDLLPFTFNQKYVSAGTSTTFKAIFVAGDNFTYVGIAGHNIGTLGGTIDITNHDTVDITAFAPIDDRPLMFIVPARTGGVDDLLITVTKGSSQQVIINHVAAGTNTDFTANTTGGQTINSDYPGGFPIVNGALNRKLRSTINDQGAPTATLIKSVSPSMRLSINNLPKSFALSSLLIFQRFWVDNGFFVQNDNDNNQSYMAFNFIPTMPKTHSRTRELVNISCTFQAFNGH